MDRKNFIKTCSFVCLGGTALTAFLQSCASTNYFAQNVVSHNQIIIKKNEFVKIQKNKQSLRKFILVKSDKYPFPICIYKLKEENYSALLMQCTHQGCELQPQDEYLVCPCHGSEFTNTGKVQRSPAEENLITFKISNDHDNLYIELP